MKRIEISTDARPLSDYADELDDEVVILTSQNRPVAALVPLRDVDEESWALSTSDVFLNLMKQAREEVRAGKTVSLEEFKRKLSA
jgi:antitoxin (DNA-binding transcriptional repressor) of toxin-antitoxin stability system